jgi:TRAP-type C4-dicarboxylate transport system permease small subunit
MDNERRAKVYKIIVLYFIAAFAATMWPIYPLFSRIRPMLLGIPFSLFYLVVIISLTFLVLLAVYLWEYRENGQD